MKLALRPELRIIQAPKMPASTPRTFTIATPSKGFPVNLCFNQFSVEDDEGCGAIVSFGYMFKGRLLEEVFTCAVSKEALDMSRETTLQYLGRLGDMLPMERFAVPPARKIVSVSLIGMAHRGGIGETLLHNFVFRRIVVDSQETEFDAEPVALMRSPVNVQRHLIKTLYT